MSHVAELNQRTVPRELLCWGLGLGVTTLLFMGLARIETTGPEVQPQVEDLRIVALPVEPPPPPKKLEEIAPQPETVPLLAGLDTGASDSPVHLAVVPPDLEKILPTMKDPTLIVPPGFVSTQLHPRIKNDNDPNRVFQESEVDQKPQAIVRVAPGIPADLFHRSAVVKVVLLLQIDADGRERNIRITKSSGDPIFDRLVVESVQYSWQFSPAIRHGKAVKCLAEQTLVLNRPGGGSPFSTE